MGSKETREDSLRAEEADKGYGIDTLIVLDREVDLVTPCLSSLTYEGMLDERFTISHGMRRREEGGGRKLEGRGEKGGERREKLRDRHSHRPGQGGGLGDVLSLKPYLRGGGREGGRRDEIEGSRGEGIDTLMLLEKWRGREE
jgi:hypothetical protein